MRNGRAGICDGALVLCWRAAMLIAEAQWLGIIFIGTVCGPCVAEALCGAWRVCGGDAV